MKDSNKRLIVVDDDPAIQDALKMIFERKGFEVTPYADGNALLDGDFEIPDLIVLDKQLSGVDGLDICRYLKAKESSRNVPVIMLSATPRVAALALAAGADDFLEKPFRMDDLLEKVNRHLAAS